jgi:hypothetical protein
VNRTCERVAEGAPAPRAREGARALARRPAGVSPNFAPSGLPDPPTAALRAGDPSPRPSTEITLVKYPAGCGGAKPTRGASRLVASNLRSARLCGPLSRMISLSDTFNNRRTLPIDKDGAR